MRYCGSTLPRCGSKLVCGMHVLIHAVASEQKFRVGHPGLALVLHFGAKQRGSCYVSVCPSCYFCQALPRSMSATLPLVVLGVKPSLPLSVPPVIMLSFEAPANDCHHFQKISDWMQWTVQWDKEIAEFLFPILAYIGLYSVLPHKVTIQPYLRSFKSAATICCCI